MCSPLSSAVKTAKELTAMTHDVVSHSPLFSLLVSSKNIVPLQKDYREERSKKYETVMPNNGLEWEEAYSHTLSVGLTNLTNPI